MSHDKEWQAAHAALLELAGRRAALDFEEGCCLLAARRAEAHRRLGYGSFTEYIERLFGYAPRVTHDKLRVAAALEGLPELALALREGRLSFSHARELTRVATRETAQIWLERVQGRTSREVEKLVSGRRPGSLPSEPAEPELQRHVLRFDVSGETLASFREALAKLRREARPRAHNRGPPRAQRPRGHNRDRPREHNRHPRFASDSACCSARGVAARPAPLPGARFSAR